MTDTTQMDNGNTSANVATGSTTVPPQTLGKTKIGQKYVAPLGRHSQQTHRRAEIRAAEQGHATEKEQHAHDRSLMVAGQEEHTARQLKQKQTNQEKPSATKKGSDPGKKQGKVVVNNEEAK